MGNHKKRKNEEQLEKEDASKKIKKNVGDQSEELDLIKSFRQGDLIFGLVSSSVRSGIYKELKKNFTNIVANDLNFDVVAALVWKQSEKEIKKFPENLRRYYLNLKESGRLLKPGGRPRENYKDRSLSIAIRRACKFLVQGANKNQSVHFELHDIDFERTCKKPHDTSYTNSELRAAYRAEKATKPNPHLFFYYKGKACEAPWNDPQHKAHWDEYEKQRRKPQPK